MIRIRSLLALAVLPFIFWSATRSEAAVRPRLQTFKEAAEDLFKRGDRAGGQNLVTLGQSAPSVPPTLSRAATILRPDFARRYAELRARIEEAILNPDHPADLVWRVDRAEAALHLVAGQLEKGEAGVTALIIKYLQDASWALSAAIAVPRSGSPPPVIAEVPTVNPDAPTEEVIPAPTIRMSVTPREVFLGEMVTVSWEVENAEKVWFEGELVEASSSRRVKAGKARSFTVKAWGPGGEARATEAIEVTVPPDYYPAASIAVVPDVINEGECAEVTWRTHFAEVAELNGESVPTSGRRKICPSTPQEFRLVARSKTDRAYAAAQIDVKPREPFFFRVLFDYNDDQIREDALDTLARIASILRSHPGMVMTIEGHTDAKGTPAYNLALGRRRAETVRTYLAQLFGLSPARFQVVSRGEAIPVAPNSRADGTDNPTGRSRNRRVDFMEKR